MKMYIIRFFLIHDVSPLSQQTESIKKGENKLVSEHANNNKCLTLNSLWIIILLTSFF